MALKPKLVVFEGVWGSAFEDLSGVAEVVRLPSEMDVADVPAELIDAARGIVVRNRTQVTARVLDTARSLGVVARAGVGLDNIDVGAADERGVVVVAPLGANAVSVGEHAVGLAIAVARDLVAQDQQTRAGKWVRTPGHELAGGTWGMLGAGATAKAAARIAGALGMTLIAHDPHVDAADPDLAALGIRLVDLAELRAASDVLSCHLPATDETIGLVDAAFLADLKPTAIFVNVGRGEVVDEPALADALEAGSIRGAALDVRAEEPPQPGRLEGLPNLVLTPHIAGITVESQRAIMERLAADLGKVLTGGVSDLAAGACREPRR
ncbi:hypothetical protein GCM10027053_17400 [Intrasporangium mesophilum]